MRDGSGYETNPVNRIRCAESACCQLPGRSSSAATQAMMEAAAEANSDYAGRNSSRSKLNVTRIAAAGRDCIGR
jgi:hypothetical protein